MNVNEWTQRTDIEHEERMELTDNLHPLFKNIILRHLPILNETGNKEENQDVNSLICALRSVPKPTNAD